MGVKKPYICVSTKHIYSSIIIVLLSAILLTLFPIKEMFQKTKVVDNTPIINPTHSPPTEAPTPSPIQKVLFPDNPEAEKGMRILRESKYGYSPYVLDIKDENRALFDGINGSGGNPIHYIRFDGVDGTKDHKFVVSYTYYPNSSTISEEFSVNTLTSEVKPVFSSMELVTSVLKPILKKVQIPSTNKSLMLPSHFAIKSENTLLSFSQPKVVDILEYCLQNLEYPYCKEYADFLGDNLSIIGKNRKLSVTIRVIQWTGTPHEWALDNVGWQGRTYRETIKEYPDFIGSESVTIGNNDFYKIGEGCCGDRTYSYMTKGFDASGKPLLIIFRAEGEQIPVEGKEGVRRMPYLEEILKTMN